MDILGWYFNKEIIESTCGYIELRCLCGVAAVGVLLFLSADSHAVWLLYQFLTAGIRLRCGFGRKGATDMKNKSGQGQ